MSHWKPPSLTQPRDDYRYSVDAWLLAAFALRFEPQFFCDLGSGSGVVAYALCQARPQAQGIAIELGHQRHRCAVQNLSACALTLLRGDLRSYPWADRVFDLIVCNPPYYELGQGKLSQNAAVASARHCLNGNLVDFLTQLQPALAPEGKVCFIYPQLGLDRLLARLAEAGWSLHAQLLIRSFADREARLVCCALQLAPCSAAVESLVLYQEHRVYTAQALQFFSPFSLALPVSF